MFYSCSYNITDIILYQFVSTCINLYQFVSICINLYQFVSLHFLVFLGFIVALYKLALSISPQTIYVILKGSRRK